LGADAKKRAPPDSKVQAALEGVIGGREMRQGASERRVSG
jgi:hypothetical protein